MIRAAQCRDERLGDQVQVALDSRTGVGVVKVASENGKSLIVLAKDEKLPYRGGFAIDPATGKMALALLHHADDIFMTLHDGTHYHLAPL